MRLRNLTETERKKMGRELNHVEDLVVFYGSDGADEAVGILRDFTQSGQHDLSIKWDGKVALYYGRDEDGEFGMGTKGNWAKNTPLRSPQEAYDYITQGGKGEDWRMAMGQDFINIFPMLEASVPVGFKGFVTGDLIFSPVLAPKIRTKQGIEFTSNQVTYIADPNSAIGKRINQTQVGMALHLRFDGWNSPNKAVINSDTVKQLNSDKVLALGQTYAPSAPQLDDSVLRSLEQMIQRHGHTIDQLLAARPKFSDIPNILYTFNNNMVRSGGQSDTESFFSWLPTSKVSKNKQAKLAEIHQENPNAFPALFDLYNKVIEVKHDIIDQLDASNTDIRAVTGGEQGGEGYVSLKHKVKLVPRQKWRVK